MVSSPCGCQRRRGWAHRRPWRAFGSCVGGLGRHWRAPCSDAQARLQVSAIDLPTCNTVEEIKAKAPQTVLETIERSPVWQARVCVRANGVHRCFRGVRPRLLVQVFRRTLQPGSLEHHRAWSFSWPEAARRKSLHPKQVASLSCSGKVIPGVETERDPIDVVFSRDVSFSFAYSKYY